MTKAAGTTPRETLLNAPLVGFHTDADSARKIAATTSGKGPTEPGAGPVTQNKAGT